MVPEAMRVLVGDIGGTKTNLACATILSDRVTLEQVRRYPSAEAPSLAAIVRSYLDELPRDAIAWDAAAFAVAGPVHGDRCKTTNLPWELDAGELGRTLELPRVRLLNDLEAIAWAVADLGDEQLLSLHEGEGEGELGVGNAVVVAAGTGLGVAGLHWDGARHHPFATEGGHADFAPTNEQELALLRHIQRTRSRASWERVASGRGIANIYAFLLDWYGATTPAWLAETGFRSASRVVVAFGSSIPPFGSAGDRFDRSAAIAEAAARGACPICVETMEMFATFYGRAAGNQALSHMALGGVYLTGGVALGNLALLERGPFLAAMFAKGRMTPLLRRMPIRVITEEHAALRGAARYGVAWAG
jgi:glucokinase